MGTCGNASTRCIPTVAAFSGDEERGPLPSLWQGEMSGVQGREGLDG